MVMAQASATHLIAPSGPAAPHLTRSVPRFRVKLWPHEIVEEIKPFRDLILFLRWIF
jgi:hypothetical protein